MGKIRREVDPKFTYRAVDRRITWENRKHAIETTFFLSAVAVITTLYAAIVVVTVSGGSL